MATEADLVAVRAWNDLVDNTTGRLDWAGLDAVAALYGVEEADLPLFVHRLLVIQRYEPPKPKPTT